MTQAITVARQGRDGKPDSTTAVIADVVGLLAIHIDLDGWGDYTLTHVPTGWAIRSGLTKRQARQLRKALAGLDWDFNSPKSRKVNALTPDVKAVFADMGLS